MVEKLHCSVVAHWPRTGYTVALVRVDVALLRLSSLFAQSARCAFEDVLKAETTVTIIAAVDKR